MSTDHRVIDPFLDDAVPSLPPPPRRVRRDRPPRRRVRLDHTPVPVAQPDDAAAPGRRARTRGPGGPERMRVERLSVLYGQHAAVKDVSLPIHAGEALALIGPSGCGKTTLLRTLNRLTETTAGASRHGRVLLDGGDVEQREVTALRRRVAMVFQQPNPFPMSIFDNVAYAIRVQNRKHGGRVR